MQDNEADELFREPNDNAYVKKEVRVGPPLDYVAEKSRNAMIGIHGLLHDLRQRQQDESFIHQASSSLRLQLVAYLALKNLMALINEDGFFSRIEGFSRHDFEEWLHRVDRGGSVV